MNEIKELQKKIDEFTQERDWDQFHNLKDLSLALSIEASELNELFLWKSPDEADVDKIKEELADIFNYTLLIASKLDVDLTEITLEKLNKNAQKYPIEKAKGSAKKYDEL